VISQKRCKKGKTIRQFSSYQGTLWNKAADPSKLAGRNAEAYARALEVAQGIMNNTIADPTGGAIFFQSGEPYGWFKSASERGDIEETDYEGDENNPSQIFHFYK
jgi:hypothetical protein